MGRLDASKATVPGSSHRAEDAEAVLVASSLVSGNHLVEVWHKDVIPVSTRQGPRGVRVDPTSRHDPPLVIAFSIGVLTPHITGSDLADRSDILVRPSREKAPTGTGNSCFISSPNPRLLFHVVDLLVPSNSFGTRDQPWWSSNSISKLLKF